MQTSRGKIEDKFPIIFTKDADFIKRLSEIKIAEGAIILLPEDAVLVRPKPPKQEVDKKGTLD